MANLLLYNHMSSIKAVQFYYALTTYVLCSLVLHGQIIYMLYPINNINHTCYKCIQLHLFPIEGKGGQFALFWVCSDYLADEYTNLAIIGISVIFTY